MTSLILRVDATHEGGVGHANRTARLLDALPVRPNVHVLGRGDALKSFFPRDTVHPLNGPVGAYLKALASETGARAVLIDEAEYDPALWAALDSLPQLQRIMIDDFGSDAPADLVINGTVIESYHAYPNLRDGGQALCGGQYALIAPDFAQARHSEAQRGPVVAVCGGGDRAAEWAMMLAEHGPELVAPHRLLLIVGAAYPDFEALKTLAVYNGGVAKQGVPPHHLSAHLARAPLTILTGGMIVYETLAAGAPAAVFPQLNNLKPEIAWFAERQAVVDLGYETGDDLDHLRQTLTELLKDAARTDALSETGPTLIDGQGLERVVAALAPRLTGQGD